MIYLQQNDPFSDYCMKHLGVSSTQLNAWDKRQQDIYTNVMVSNSVTPIITEESDKRFTQMSVFDKLLQERIMWILGPVNDLMSTVVQAQLLYLSSENQKTDIKFYVDTPGGSVKSGLSIIDSMHLSPCDISTINVGMAASMGSVILGAGTKGKRLALPNSKVMLHQVSHGMEGNIQDTEITFTESKKYNNILFNYLGEFTGKPASTVMADATRDLWFNTTEAIEYGIIDEKITK